MTYRKSLCCKTVLLFSVAVAGCSRTDPLQPPSYPVSGTVMLDGRNLPAGVITFRTTNLGLIERLPIKDGAFTGSASAGQRRIEFSVIKDGPHPGPTMPGIKTPESIQIETLPAVFNTASTFTATVTPEGPNIFTFELRSQ